MDIKSVWNSDEKIMWEKALENYQTAVKSNNTGVAEKLCAMSTDDFGAMSGQDFYRFLVGDYARWKYTDGRIRNHVQSAIEEFHQTHTDHEIKRVLDGILAINPDDIYLHLANITRINGIGVAGASGILALILPQYFGTVDRFTVENLQKVYDENSFYGKKLHNMDPQSLSIYDAMTVIQIYREKAEKLNRTLGDGWTPRKIDMILWSIR